MERGELVSAVQFLIETGLAHELGQVVADGFTRNAGQPGRDQLAAMAMQGLMAAYGQHGHDAPTTAQLAYATADAMLAERAKKGTP